MTTHNLQIDLHYPRRIDYQAGINAVNCLPRPRRVNLYKSDIPPASSAVDYIKSRRWMYSHETNCQCSKCGRKYKLPINHVYRCDFQIESQLGAGAFGATAALMVNRGASDWNPWQPDEPIVREWSGHQVEAGFLVAAKRILTRNAKDPADFLREVKALQALKGCGFVMYMYGFKVPTYSDPWGHIFMPLCSLGDCHAMMDRYFQAGEHMPETFLYRFTEDMCKALQWLNSGTKGNETRSYWLPWTHNDIKPNNVLIETRPPNSPFVSPIFVLADLGLACDSYTIAPGGCIQFLSPQRRTRMGAHPATHKDDMFAFGVSLFLMANYEFPYPRHQQLEETETHSKFCLDYGYWHPYLNPYSLWFNNLITGLTSLEPDERLAADEAYAYILEGIQKYGVGDGGSQIFRYDTSWVNEQTWQRYWGQAGMGGTAGRDIPERLRIGSGSRGSFFGQFVGNVMYASGSMPGFGY